MLNRLQAQRALHGELENIKKDNLVKDETVFDMITKYSDPDLQPGTDKKQYIHSIAITVAALCYSAGARVMDCLRLHFKDQR